MPRFFISTPISAGLVVLPKDAARHVSVLRLSDGDAITLFDGTGGQWQARLQISGKTVSAQALTHRAEDHTSAVPITLLQAMTSTDKLDYIVQKCTELGVARVWPFAAARSVVRLDAERAAKRIAHLQAVAVAACEQCGLNRVPQVAPVRSLAQCVTALQAEQTRIVTLALQDAQPIQAITRPAPGQALAVAIGPEGDFTSQELALLDAAKAQRLSLGPRVLRTETAGVAVLAMLQALWP